VETNIKAVTISYSKEEYKGEFTRLGWHIQEFNSLLLVYSIIYFSPTSNQKKTELRE